MLRPLTALLLAPAVLAACAGNPDKRTLSELRRVEPEMSEVRVENGLQEAMRGYRQFLDQAPESALTPEAMRRLADLNLEKEYGILGDGDSGALPAPKAGPIAASEASGAAVQSPARTADRRESQHAFEARAAASETLTGADGADLALPDGQSPQAAGPLEAIQLYDRILTTYPDYEHNDRVLYQKARAYDELGRPDEAIAVAERLISEFPHSRHIDEVQFRRAEYFFTRRRYLDAEEAYAAITARGAGSDFYELALYKLGWTLYKQELHEEAVNQYIALLDYKVASGYDFDQSDDQDSSRRIADTFRVVSLSFSSLGGPEAVGAYFVANATRPYEDRVYSHLGEFYFEKLRYQDAADAYEAFVGLHPRHRSAPNFGMRVVEIYEAGGFPKLVLDSKKEFAAGYGIGAEYWEHFQIEEAPEVLAYLKGTLRDLANHYHAAYQDPEQADERPASYGEARQWYRTYLASFPEDAEAPGIHHQLADLLLENEDFGEAAREYERTAYDYPRHEQAAEAGYAAIFAHREEQKRATGEERETVREAAVSSTLRFVESFPDHEHAAVVLGAAVGDLYEMERYGDAIAIGRRLIADYPSADPATVRAAWLAVAHSAFALDDYPQAEGAYAHVLERTSNEDDSRQAVVDNLAASIYKQGELASAGEDHRAAADHFLRIAQVAPGSAIRPAAEYDAGAALIRLEDWDGAVAVLNAFRDDHPEHELRGEATKQLAQVHREQGDFSLAAGEYERIAGEAEDAEVRREASLVAGELYEEAAMPDRALGVYLGYVDRYPEPLEIAVETRFKIAAIYAKTGDEKSRHAQLRGIIESDRTAGAERTDRIRYLAARSSLVMTEGLYDRAVEVELVQPFDRSLKMKRKRMDEALAGFGKLVDYEVGEVTAAATFYVAEVYRDFGASLLASERPSDLSSAQRLDYEMFLEEEAFRFEEKAIEVHEKNLELMDAAVYNRWIEKSLSQLGELMPGRYAKFEESSGPILSMDRYAYLVPTAPGPDPILAAEGGDALPMTDAVEAPETTLEPVPAAPAFPDSTEAGDDAHAAGW